MSNLIKFAVEFGSSAKLRSMTEAELIKAMELYELTEQEQSAILSREPKRLRDLGNGDIYCILMPEKPDEDENDDEEKDTESKIVNF